MYAYTKIYVDFITALSLFYLDLLLMKANRAIIYSWSLNYLHCQCLTMCCMSKDMTKSHDSRRIRSRRSSYSCIPITTTSYFMNIGSCKKRLTVELANTKQCNWTKQLGSLATLKKEGTNDTSLTMMAELFQHTHGFHKILLFDMFTKKKLEAFMLEHPPCRHVGLFPEILSPYASSYLGNAVKRIRFCTWIREFCSWISMCLIPFPILGRCVYDRICIMLILGSF